MKTKDISDEEVYKMLDCPTCFSVIVAITEKKKKYGCTLFEAYDLVANEYNISFGFIDIDVKKSKYCPFFRIDGDYRDLNEFTTITKAQEEILHSTMYELAKRIENCKKSIYE